MDKLKIFTDGACSGNPGPGGWGAVFAFPDGIVKLSGGEWKTTNNRMELLSVVKSLEKVFDDLIEVNIIEINSDSAYVVNSINQNWLSVWKANNWKTSKGDNIKNYDLWTRMVQIIDYLNWVGISVEFKKVKGHSGNPLNELADEIAKKEIIKTEG